MGLRDFFRRGNGRSSNEPNPPDDLPDGLPDDVPDELRDELQGGPSVHYVLAHLALRQNALANPLAYLAMLPTEDGRHFLEELFERVAQEFDPAGRTPFSADDLLIHPVRVHRYPCAIVEMPVPHRTAEAYFTALVALIDPTDEVPEPEDVPARYFTLEKGMSFDGRPRTVFAEWDGSAHLNFGEGPEPKLGDFVERVTEAVQGAD